MFFLVLSKKTNAQSFDNAGQYMDYIGKQHVDIDKKFLSYNSAVSHGKRARKVENLRTKLIDEVQTAIENVRSMPPYKGDKRYRDSVVSFLKFYNNILNDDYSRIVNMEDIAEQSYDEMSAYLLLKETIDKKVDEANVLLHIEEENFALQNNVHLVQTTNNISDMMEEVGKVNKYYDKVYLVFFKSYKEEENLWDAVKKKDVNAIEQDKNAVLQYSTDGLKVLDTTKAFEGDLSLVNNCRNLLKFYISEMNDKIGTVSDYILKEESFEKLKNDFDNNSNHSKDDINAYNKSIKDINDAVNNYNNTNNQLYEKRTDLLNNWNNGVNSFMDEHMPKYK